MSAFAWFAIVAGILILAAVACVAVPLWRDRARPISTAALTAVCLLIPALGLLTYFQSSNHEWAHSELQIGDDGQPLALERLVGPLRERLEQSPQDAQGWMLLGASYSQLGDYPQAVEAFDRVLALTGGRDPDALMGKAEALILESPERLLQEAGDMVEQALEFDPTHPKGLWYGGLRASARGETVTAVRRWRAMLEGPVTPEVREIVERELANLGASGPALAAPADANAGASTGIVELRLSLAEGASPPPGAVLFIVARIPGQPGPPLAAKRIDGGLFPLATGLDDGDAMLPGAKISDQPELAITARLSVSGQTTRNAGDFEAQGQWQAGQGALELELSPAP